MISASPHRERSLKFDLPFLVAGSLLLIIGGMAIFSVDQALRESLFKKQVIQFILGLVPVAIFWYVPGSAWRKLANVLYAFNLFLLSMVLMFGDKGKGATRWLDIGILRFQPSEMSKLILVITLSTFFYVRREEVGRFRTFALSILHVLPVMVLLYLQPHLGAAVTVLVAWLTIALVANVHWKIIASTIAIGLAMFGVAFKTGLLKEYMSDRVEGLINRDKSSNGYQQHRSEVAFGVGGLTGTGYLKGEQKQLKGVPEQENDFIFSVVGEEAGFIGSLLVLLVYAAYFLRGWYIGATNSDLFARMAALGTLSVLGFHLTVNLAMVLGVGPVVGLWLPFMSYGGTALWLCMSSTAFILSLCRPQEVEMFGHLKQMSWEE